MMKHLPKHFSLGRCAVVASLLIGLVCAVASISSVSLLPPKIASRNLEQSAATTSVLLDFPHPAITTEQHSWQFVIGSLTKRAALLARLMATAPGVQYIAHEAGLPPGQIAADAPVTVSEQGELVWAGSEQRARQLLLASDPYQLEIESSPTEPVINVYAQAPSPAAADRLADAVIAGLRDYLRVLEARAAIDPAAGIRIYQLGQPQGGVINSGAKEEIALLTFVFAFVLSLVILRALARRLSRRTENVRPAPAPDPLGSPGSGVPSRAAVALSAAAAPRPPGIGRLAAAAPGGAVALPQWQLALPDVRSMVGRAGDWPRTTRVLPWMLAAFMAMIWLVPFDSIQLRGSFPIDMHLDRVLLPMVAITWLLSVIKGGPDAPRIRVTRIHIAIGIFVGVAFLSVVVNATSLNHTLELDNSIKQVPLLISYSSLFVMMASTVRRTEIRAFLTFTLALAAICAVGMIVEDKTQYNVFFDLASKDLPSGLFSVTVLGSGFSAGREITHGPTQEGLIAATMLSMALVIAITRIMDAHRPRARVIYTLLAGIVTVGIFVTQKKTGLIAPAVGVLTIGCFRRRELLRMVPVAVLLLVAVLIVSPGTVTPLIRQFTPSQFGPNAPDTTSARDVTYDAIRPDVWTHLALGRGYGSYMPTGHRIVDSELLLRLVEMGVIGVAAFFWLGLSVVATARRTINARHPGNSPPALAAAAAAAVFLVAGALFTELSYPQVPYILFYLAAFVAVIVKPPDERLTTQP